MDFLYAGMGEIVANAWVEVASDGQILEIGQGRLNEARMHLKGLVFGGLVNAHCHLELSHLRGGIPTGTGMAGFVMALQGIRGNFKEEVPVQAAVDACRFMRSRGVMGVGDIVNGIASLKAKQSFPEMEFHSFVVVFGLDSSRSDEIFTGAMDLVGQFGQASLTLHAPYSVSKALRDKVQHYASIREWPQSLHVLESAEERLLFGNLEGPLMEMLRSFKAPFPGHESHSPAHFLLENQPSNCNTLLVHLAEASREELEWMSARFGEKGFAVLCPSANAFIHGSLPPLEAVRNSGLKICLGTDSLAGNWDLDLWKEMKLLQEKFGVPTSDLLMWAIDHGVEALQFKRHGFIHSVGGRWCGFQLLNFNGKEIPKLPEVKGLEI